MGLVGPGALLNLVLRKPKRFCFIPSLWRHPAPRLPFAFHFQFISSLIVFLLVISYILLYFSIISLWSVCQSDHRSSVRANEWLSLLQCNVYIERFHSQTCDLPGMIPGSLCALILSAQKQTNKPTKGKSGNLMGIQRGSSQS